MHTKTRPSELPSEKPIITTTRETPDPTVLRSGQSATTRPSLLHTWYVSPAPPTYPPNPLNPPKQHAHSAELLLPYLRGHPDRGARVLDVGAGSGYLTSVLHHLVSERGSDPAAQHQDDSTATAPASDGAGAVVVGIEHIPELTALAERNIRADGLGGAIDEQAIVLVTGDGRLGTPPLFPSFPSLSLSLKCGG